ncbi:DEKNAAC100384 [Brettanomyces naardenensis]|uniref:DEKNAAC100384 n=1 Tax=Brettanomyces naardenensis TaxID=13370 RepID=A0A448YG41_BRENA|nr:DEKNAAC100384 [Brettanomyces naardenensis]
MSSKTSSIIKSAKSILPTFDRVLVRRIKAAQQTTSGIYIPEKNLAKPNVADVVAVGPGYTAQGGQFIKPTVAVGDKVLIPPHGGSPISVEKEEYLLFRDSDILAKIKDEE